MTFPVFPSRLTAIFNLSSTSSSCLDAKHRALSRKNGVDREPFFTIYALCAKNVVYPEALH